MIFFFFLNIATPIIKWTDSQNVDKNPKPKMSNPQFQLNHKSQSRTQNQIHPRKHKSLCTSARAARRRIRLERDLEPGNLTVPEISLMGCNTISGDFSAVETEVETLSAALVVPLPWFKHHVMSKPFSLDPNCTEPNKGL